MSYRRIAALCLRRGPWHGAMQARVLPPARRTAGFAGLIGAVLLAGCGAGGGGGGAGGGARAAFVSAAESICRQETAQLRHFSVNSPAALFREAPQQIRIEQAANAKLAALKPPAALGADWRSITSHYRAATRDYQSLVAAVRRHRRTAAVHASSAGREEVLGAHELAVQDGLTACGKV